MERSIESENGFAEVFWGMGLTKECQIHSSLIWAMLSIWSWPNHMELIGVY